MAALQDYREGGDGSSYWEASRLLTIYTFKRAVHASARTVSTLKNSEG